MRARVILTFVLPLAAAFAYACGGDDSTDVDGSADAPNGGDVTVNDTGTNKDGSNPTDASDSGTSADTGSTDGGGPTDAAVETSLGCTLPTDCNNEFCCGTIVFNGGQLPHCDLKSASSACAATCKSDIALSCNATDTVRACAANADCVDAGANYNKCCTVAFSDAAATFCWSANLAGLAGGTCM
jgi:hypothetical protein